LNERLEAALRQRERRHRRRAFLSTACSVAQPGPGNPLNQRWDSAPRDCGDGREGSSIGRSHPASASLALRAGSPPRAAANRQQEHPMLELIGAILVGAFALTFGVLCVGPMVLKSEDQ